MKFLSIGFALFAMTATAFAYPQFELRRITVKQNLGNAGRVTLRCHITPNQVLHQTKIAEITSQRKLPLNIQNVEQVTKLVKEAQGVYRPDQKNARQFTNWWVRTGNSDWKLIRSNTTDYYGSNKVLQDESYAGRILAVFEGINCFQNFGG